MQKRSYIRIISFTVFALVVLIASVLVNTANMNKYKSQLEVNYQQSLTELSECLNNVNTDLNKTLYSGSSGEIYDLNRDLYAQCATAKNALSRLPVGQMELGNTYKFLSQASDYAQYIGAKIEKGEKISDEEHKNIKVLLEYAEKFSNATSEMVNIVAKGGKISSGEVTNTENLSVTSLSNGFSRSATTFEDFPTLLYDGPFSDQVLNKKSALVQKAKLKTKEQCAEIAAKVIGVSKNKINFSGADDSKIPGYTYKSGRYTVIVTKQGGYIKSILYSGTAPTSSISVENAINIGTEFLKYIGYADMKECYYIISENICTISYVYCKNNVYYYPDLIKCSVSLDDGKVLSIDAATYLTNHTDRKATEAKKSEKDCRKSVSSYMKINSVKQCVIPKESGIEVDCYEYRCTGRDTGEDALIYINCDTGNEEDIMLLLNSENGTLVK